MRRVVVFPRSLRFYRGTFDNLFKVSSGGFVLAIAMLVSFNRSHFRIVRGSRRAPVVSMVIFGSGVVRLVGFRIRYSGF